jgi:hypothetical protein
MQSIPHKYGTVPELCLFSILVSANSGRVTGESNESKRYKRMFGSWLLRIDKEENDNPNNDRLR